MRIVITAILLALSTIGTALSVALLPYYDDKSGQLEPLVFFTIALWALFALAVVSLRGVRSTRAAIVLVLVGAAAIGGAAMAGPPNTSTDSARYAWDGIVQNAGYSPYAYPPAAEELAHLRPEWLFPAPVRSATGELECVGSRILTVKVNDDSVLCTAINRAKVTTIYPPASEIVFAGVRALTGPEPAYWPMQLAGFLISLGITGVLLKALLARGRDPRWAALWAWSPLVATEGITNSHIDILGALLLLVATLLVSSRRPWLAGVALGAAISVKLIPAIGSFALLRRNPVKVIVGAVAVFALLYVPFVLASGIGVLGYLPGYLSEEGYVTGTRFILVSLVVPGPAATVVSGILIAALAGLVWWKSNPDDPWLAQVVMIGGTLAIVSPRYPWYALLLVPMIAMSGRWEWLAIPLALTERLLWGNIAIARGVMAAAIVFVVVMTWHRYRKSNRTITVENNSNLSSEGRRTQINTNRVPRPQTKE